MGNNKIFHLVDCFLHSSDSVSSNITSEVDKLNLNERYGLALKACHDVGTLSSSFFFNCCYIFLIVTGSFLPQLQPSRFQQCL